MKVSLGECCEIISGATPKISVETYWDGEFCWATPKDLSNLVGPYIADTPRKITEAGLRSCSARLLPTGSVLLSSRAPIGHVAINKVPMATNQGFKSLIPNPLKVDAKYLYHWLRTNRSYLDSLGNGATFKEVSKEVVARVEIPLPDIREQRRIADLLDQVELLRAKRSEAVARLDELTQAIFLDMFGNPIANLMNWPKRTLGQLLTSIESGRSPKCLNRTAAAGEWGVLKLSAVTRCRYDSSQSKALPQGIAPSPENEVKVGDLLFSRKNTYNLIAACALVRSTPQRLLIPDLIFRLRLQENSCVDPTFLHCLLIYPAKRREIQALAGGSAGSMPNISKARLRTALVELPPISLQRDFAHRIEAIEHVAMSQRAHLAELDALFASLQYRAFRGEL